MKRLSFTQLQCSLSMRTAVKMDDLSERQKLSRDVAALGKLLEDRQCFVNQLLQEIWKISRSQKIRDEIDQGLQEMASSSTIQEMLRAIKHRYAKPLDKSKTAGGQKPFNLEWVIICLILMTFVNFILIVVLMMK